MLPRSARNNPFCLRLLKRRSALRFVNYRTSLDRAQKRYIGALKRCGWLRSFDKARVLVYDYRNRQMVNISSNVRTSAASLIKPYVMFAVYYRAHRRGIHPTRFSTRLQRQINRMMRVSSNRDTNRLIRYLGNGSSARGLRYINRLLPRYGIRRTRLVELIPAGGKTYRNYTTARDLNLLLYHIYGRKVISRGYAAKMIHVMLKSRDNRGRTYYLKSRFGLQAATKTGYTKRTNGVAGIFFKGRSTYNFVAILTRPLIKNANEWRWRKVSTPVIQRLSEMTFAYYQRGYSKRDIATFKYKGKKRRTRVALR